MQRAPEFNSNNPTHNNDAELKTRRGIYGSPHKKKRSNIQIEHPNVAVKKREPEFD